MGNSTSSLIVGSGAPGSRRLKSQDKAILELKLLRDKVHIYQQKLYKNQDLFLAQARESLKNGRETRARTILKIKKYEENMLDRSEAQLITLEQLVKDIEYAQIQKDIVFGIEQGNRALKQIQSIMSVEKVQRIMADTAEAQAYQQEVDDVISGQMSRQDEDEVESEWKALVNEYQKEEGTTDISAKLPQAPKSIPVSNGQDEAETRLQEDEEDQVEEPAMIAN